MLLRVAAGEIVAIFIYTECNKNFFVQKTASEQTITWRVLQYFDMSSISISMGTAILIKVWLLDPYMARSQRKKWLNLYLFTLVPLNATICFSTNNLFSRYVFHCFNASSSHYNCYLLLNGEFHNEQEVEGISNDATGIPILPLSAPESY